MPSQSGHSTRPHAKVPPSFLDMDACTTSQLNFVLYFIDPLRKQKVYIIQILI